MRLSFGGPWPSEIRGVNPPTYHKQNLFPMSDYPSLALEIREKPGRCDDGYVLSISGEDPDRRMGYQPFSHELVDIDKKAGITVWKKMAFYPTFMGGGMRSFIYVPQGNVATKRLIVGGMLDRLYKVARNSKGTDIDKLNESIQAQGMGEDGKIEPGSVASDVIYGHPLSR